MKIPIAQRGGVSAPIVGIFNVENTQHIRQQDYTQPLEAAGYSQQMKLLVLLLLAGCTGAAVRAPSSELSGPELTVTFLDVNGDSILVQNPNGKTLLVDAGSVNSSVSQWLDALHIDKLDGAMATHPDKDHIGGFLNIQQQIKLLLEPGVPCSTKVCSSLNQNGVIARYGYRLELDPDVEMTVLNPRELFEKDNDNSIVLKITYGQTSFLLTGDCESKCEEALQKQDIDVDVLKVAHHGSKSSTSQKFLEAATPAIAVIGVGPNQYGHPHKELLDRLQGIETYRTDEGTVRIRSDGKHLAVERLSIG